METNRYPKKEGILDFTSKIDRPKCFSEYISIKLLFFSPPPTFYRMALEWTKIIIQYEPIITTFFLIVYKMYYWNEIYGIGFDGTNCPTPN